MPSRQKRAPPAKGVSSQKRKRAATAGNDALKFKSKTARALQTFFREAARHLGFKSDNEMVELWRSARARPSKRRPRKTK